MDVLLDILDTYVFDRFYAAILPATNPVTAPAGTYNKHIGLYYPLPPSPYADSSTWKRDDIVRQTMSLFLIGWIFATALYLIGSTIIYHTLFDKRVMRHPHFLPNQIRQEIRQGITSIPVIAVLTAPFFLAEVRGWTKLYDFADEAPFRAYNWLQYPLFVCFTDCGIYWIHRGLHYPPVYRWLHKPHHKWIMPSPFASYAFHPVDGWSQSIPYHVYPLLFPLQKSAYLGLFVFVTMWTVFIREFSFHFFFIVLGCGDWSSKADIRR
ncbi:hypothetical protein AFCA_012425 [Aspergillus flavus]|nr:hypothetical protein AFCA_012425 [Aspergillus flavus]